LAFSWLLQRLYLLRLSSGMDFGRNPTSKETELMRRVYDFDW
jgi:hypothetical protein